MKERGILFSGPMVRAILDNRKTQTRRVVKPGKGWAEDWRDRAYFDPKCLFHGPCLHVPVVREDMPGDNVWERIPSPYGIHGDRLWVRETWQKIGDCPVCYAAGTSGCGACPSHTWRPSIFMKREDSRITLEVTDVRVERVQDISQADAKAEGINPVYHDTYGDLELDAEYIDAPGGFKWLWDSINDKRGFGWDANPWVWAITFKRLGD